MPPGEFSEVSAIVHRFASFIHVAMTDELWVSLGRNELRSLASRGAGMAGRWQDRPAWPVKGTLVRSLRHGPPIRGGDGGESSLSCLSPSRPLVPDVSPPLSDEHGISRNHPAVSGIFCSERSVLPATAGPVRTDQCSPG